MAVAGAGEQVLDNLLSNALHASPVGGRVSVVVRPGPVSTEVHVADEGPGMTDEQRARAFERFWRSPQAPGTGFGLGLAIVRELVRASGGDVRLESVPGGPGLEVVATFPTAPRRATAEASPGISAR
jgi:signal transduction histidine kinase